MHPARQSRRLSAVRHLAGLFDRYALHRPAMLEAWARGEDLDAAGRRCPRPGLAGRAVAPAARADRGPGPGRAPAPRLRADRRDPSLLDLPARFALFGLTRLPAGHLEILRALARRPRRSPVPAAPLAVAVGDGDSDRSQRRSSRAGPTTRPPTLPANRLLASWGRDAREMQLVLAAGAPELSTPTTASGAPAAGHAARPHPGRRARATAPPPARRCPARRITARCWRPTIAASRSTPVTAARARSRWSATRSCTSLADGPALEPRDVIVMCPDIETFAPLIQATFGAGDLPDDDGAPLSRRPAPGRPARPPGRPLAAPDQPGPRRRGRAARAGRAAADRLPGARPRRPRAGPPPLSLDDDDITRCRTGSPRRGSAGVSTPPTGPRTSSSALTSGTWQTGLDRLLLGVTMTEDGQRLFAGVLPLDDVDSRAIDLAGRFAELIDRLGDAVDAPRAARQTLAELGRRRSPRPPTR